MNLFIYTGATDIAQAAVTSLTDTTAVSQLKQIVAGDDEPLTVQFTNGTAAPTWASDATYVLTVALGAPTPAGLDELTKTATFTLTGATRTGYLDCSVVKLVDYLRYNIGEYPGRQNGICLTLQIRIATPTGENITYAALPVVVMSRVIS